MKKEKRVEKWISLGTLSLVASLQEWSTLQNRRRNRQDFLERENNSVLPSAWNLRMSELSYSFMVCQKEGGVRRSHRSSSKSHQEAINQRKAKRLKKDKYTDQYGRI